MKVFLWIFSLSFALGLLIPFGVDTWQFFALVGIGNILIIEPSRRLRLE